jgi:tetratricopeptide (TPR) repeat protein
VAIGFAGLLAGLLGGCRDPLATKYGLVNEGDRHFYRAEYLQAIGAYKEAVKQDPSDADVLDKIGECHMYLRNYREAMSWYRKALQFKPGDRKAADGLAQANRMLPNLAPQPITPEPTAEPVNVPSPRVVAEGYIKLAQTYEAQNELDRAEENYKKARDAADNEAFTHAALGRFYMRTNRNAEAIAELKQAQLLNQSEPNVAEDLAKLGAR